jgi:hypothetical protein
MRTAMHAALPGLQELAAFIDDSHATRTGYGGRARLIEDSARPSSSSSRIRTRSAAPGAGRSEVVRPGSTATARAITCVHRNGNNLAILPNARSTRRMPWNTSPHACAREHGEIVTFGMGDSRSDARFMAACDYAIIPRGTQLAALTVEAL